MEVKLNDCANQPYISYKELKQIIADLERLVAMKRICDRALSPGEKDFLAAPSGDSGGARCDGPPSASSSDLQARQCDFFQCLEVDTTRCVSHARSIMESLQAEIGEWQSAAVIAGLLFTPEQLEQLSAVLPFEVRDEQVLVQWLAKLQVAGGVSDRQRGLVVRYAKIANTVAALLNFIEVNLAAVRKILKKFEKRIPGELRIKSGVEFKEHYELVGPAMQNMLVTLAGMQRLIAGIGSSDDGADAAAPSFPVVEVGVETCSTLRSLPSPAVDLAELLGEREPSEVDVYAKPPAHGSAGIDPKSPTVGTTHNVRAKDALNVTNIRADQTVVQHAAQTVCLAELL